MDRGIDKHEDTVDVRLLFSISTSRLRPVEQALGFV